ncbi:MAG: type I glyceraldehyde-3-phosphate dehydrogenase [Gammaproteobacteria bacterium]
MTQRRIAINGYGRIGRNVLRAFHENARYRKTFSIVAINDLGDARINAHLTRHDSVHGPFPGSVEVVDDALVVNGDRVQVVAERDPERLPWKSLGIDLVLECTGCFASRAKSEAHLRAGAQKVLISAPAGADLPTIVYGVNHTVLAARDTIVSNASCTTNCLAPLAHVLHAGVGIERGLMNTVHASTNDQVLIDVYHTDLRRARSALLSMIPTKTGAAAAIGQVIPDLAGRLDGLSIRVPTANVSIVDLTFLAARDTTLEEVDALIRKAADGPLKGILAVNDEPLVSIDFNHNTASSTYDATLTKVTGRLVKVLAWYDNEWGFSNRMLDTASVMLALG